MSDFSTYLKTSPDQPSQGIIGGYLSRIGSDISSATNEATQSQIASQEGKMNPLAAGANIFKNVTAAVASPITEAIPGFVKNAFNATGQAFVNSPTGQATTDVLSKVPPQALGAASDIFQGAMNTGAIYGATELPEQVSNIWDKASAKMTGPNKVDVAQENLANQAQTTATAMQQATEELGTYRNTTMGQQFTEVPQMIEKTNPELKYELSNDQIDALNRLKDTQKFMLPDYLRVGKGKGVSSVGYVPENLSDIENLYKLSPTQTQDLITRLNDLTFKAKASGDLAINQQTIDLAHSIKEGAQKTFGGVSDAQGNSLWGKNYENFAKQATIVNKMSDLINIEKNAGPADMASKMDTFKKLLDDPTNRNFVLNGINELKRITGVDLTNLSGEVDKLLNSEKLYAASQKPGFLKQMFSPNMVGRMGMRVVLYATLGAWLRSAIKSISQ